MADFSIEDEYEGTVCGLDEVGRGPLAGPVVAACVIIPKNKRKLDFIESIKDSKKLSEKKREDLYRRITEELPYSISEITPEEIDEINILQASLKAMKIAHDCFEGIDHALVDGNKAPKDLYSHAITVIKGDAKSKSIAAASIVAKVYRDNIMCKLDALYPCYGWRKNSGYPTAQHREAIKAHGITPHHRKSFAPVRRFIESSQ